MKIILLLLAVFALGCKTYYAPNGKAFPKSWGSPPEMLTKDYRPLPYGYGHGSSTLYNWIMFNKYEVQKRLNNLGGGGVF